MATVWEYDMFRLQLLTPHDVDDYGDVPNNDLDHISLNQMGEDGWELVAVVPAAEGAIAYFKRPKST